MRALVTGITGFAGSHLADYLLDRKDVEIYGTARWRSRTENIEGIRDRIKLVECDLLDATAVDQAIQKVKPDLIFHLAAQSFVPTSWLAPAETLMNNVLGELNLFEAVRRAGIDPLIQIACSSEEYGLVHEDEVPINEENPLRPQSPYAVSKITQDFLGYQYFRSYGLRVIRTRTFNHTGPRRGEVFVTSCFAKQIAEIEHGLAEPVLKVGNLEARRDFTDVRDVVRAYWLALERGEPGEVYVIASGRDYKISDVAKMLLSMSAVPIRIEQDPARMRPSDVPVLLGDSTKFRRRTGWEPLIPFEKTLADLLQYWRARVACGAACRGSSREYVTPAVATNPDSAGGAGGGGVHEDAARGCGGGKRV
ncbi:MAG: GDP-mannose 4,6-dehydratase [Clostridia bacterium]